MHLIYSQWWFILLVPVALVLIYLYVYLANMQRSSTIGNPLLVQSLIVIKPWVLVIKQFCLILSITFVAIALLRPQWGVDQKQVVNKGLDLVIALDVSGSMAAKDITPSRKERAISEIRSLLSRLQGDRVGLVTFAGSATAIMPLTADYAAVDLFVSTMQNYQEQIPGTNLDKALREALMLFDVGAPQDKLLIIFSDGENHEGDYANALRLIKSSGIIVAPVAVGSVQGQAIPQYNQDGQRTGYLRDKAGNVVISRVNMEILQSIAAVGPYLLNDNQSVVNQLVRDFQQYQRGELEEIHFEFYRDRFQLFIFLALLAWLFFLLFNFGAILWSKGAIK